MKNAALDLMNSYHLRGRPGMVDDELVDAAWVRRFAKRWSLGAGVEGRELSRLRALRDLLRHVVAEASERGTLTAASIERLNAFAEPREVRSILARGTGGALTRVEAAARQASPADVVVRAFQELVAGDGLQRLKLCANPLCRWAYYDESRNRSRRWCDSAECGNVMKVRAFRARQQASDADS